MASKGGTSQVTVALPPWVVSRLQEAVQKGQYGSVEDAVVTGAKLVAGLGPRVQELLQEGATADDFVRQDDPSDGGQWL